MDRSLQKAVMQAYGSVKPVGPWFRCHSFSHPEHTYETPQWECIVLLISVQSRIIAGACVPRIGASSVYGEHRDRAGQTSRGDADVLPTKSGK